MRIAVVGLGYWGSKHVRVFSALPAVTAVVGVDARESRRRELSAAFPALTTAASLEEALPQVDAVVVATPPSSHVDLGLCALTAGKHVLVEKPLATSPGDARALVAAAQCAGRVLLVGHTFAYNPAVLALRDCVRRGELGRVLHLDGQRLNLGLFQEDCDVVWDLAPHDVSIANTVLGAVPTAVAAWGTGSIRRDVVDDAYLRLDYGADGPRAVIHLSWLHPQKVRRLTVVGSDRMAVYDDMAADERLRIYDKGIDADLMTASHDAPMSYRYGDIRSPWVPFREPLAIEAQHFLDCITHGEQPLTGGAEGVAVVDILHAASRSLRTGELVQIDSTPGAGSATRPLTTLGSPTPDEVLR